MKRVVSFLLVLCLVFGLASVALAAGAPKITKQPESAISNKNGTVTFEIKLKNFKNGGITWKLINPETEEIINASQIATVFKGVKVSGANRTKLTLKKVPPEMHGWSVYCHISQNGYTIDSDIVELRVYEVENATPTPPPETPAEETPAQETPAEVTPAPEVPAEETPAQEQPAEVTPAPEVPAEVTAAPDAPVEQQPEQEAVPEITPEPTPAYVLDDEGEIEEEESIITINGENVALYPLDSRGNVTSEEKATTLTFEDAGNVKVIADGPVNYWIIDGMRFEPADPLSGFTLKNVTHSLDISAVLQQASASDNNIDDSVQFTVTCEGCTFTYLKGDISSAVSGSVPSGASVTVMADTSELADRGYCINGGEASHEGQASFRLKITEDTTIVCK